MAVDLHHPRPGGRVRPLRPGPGDVRRPDRRDGRHARPLLPPPPSLHPRPSSARSRRSSPRARNCTRSPGFRPTSPRPFPGCPFAPRCEFAVPALPSRPRSSSPRWPPGTRRPACGSRPEKSEAPAMADTILELRDVKTHFPVHRGFLRRRAQDAVRAVDGVSLVARTGRGAGPGRRIRLRQVHPRPDDPPTGAGDRRRRHPQRPQSRRGLRAGPAGQPARPADGLPGPLRLAQPAAERLRRAGRAPAGPPRVPAGGGPGAGRRADADWSGSSPRLVRKYPHEFSGGQRQRIADRPRPRPASPR